MDIWFTTRNVNGNDIDFTMPVNLGGQINTHRDEITPFYTLENATLYFASNGHPSIGGYDTFQSSGSHTQWERPENLGYPFNSSADDFYYVLRPSRAGGYFVSNRSVDSKPETTHEDIFSFLLPSAERAQLKIIGSVHNREDGNLIPEVTISLYEQSSPGTKLLVDNYFFTDGNFDLKLPRTARFLLEFKSPGYYPFTQVLNAASYPMQEEFTLPVQLEPEVIEEEPEVPLPILEPEKSEDPTPEPPQDEENAEDPVPYTTRGQSPADNLELVTAAPRKDGTYFKVQLIAVVTYNPDHARYRPVKDLGRIDTEYIIDRELYRVLLADFDSLSDANATLELVKERGFEGAYIVEYRDGERIGRVR
jgi:cell division septation protein DedD